MTRQFFHQCMTVSMLLAFSCEALAQASNPVVTPGPAASVAPQTGDTLLVTGLPSVLEHPKTLFGALFYSDALVCVDFSVRSVGHSTSQLRITSSGIGGARLVDLTGAGAGCVESERTAATSIALTNVVDAERPVRLILPTTSFPEVSGGAKGKLLLLRPGLPVTEVAFLLRREDYPPFDKAFLWFLGIAVPATLAAAIGLGVYRIQKAIDAKSTENEALERLRRDGAADLKAFFEGLYQTTMTLQDDLFRSTMERELADKRILSGLPRKALDRLLKALRVPDREKVARELAGAFPDNKDAILKPIESAH